MGRMFLLSVVSLLLCGCGVVNVGPRSSQCLPSPGGGMVCQNLSLTVGVTYEALCDARCSVRFSIPEGYGAEEFDGRLRRTVDFRNTTAHGVTMTVEPKEATDVVKDARISVEGRLIAHHSDNVPSPGRAVTVTGVVRRGSGR